MMPINVNNSNNNTTEDSLINRKEETSEDDNSNNTSNNNVCTVSSLNTNCGVLNWNQVKKLDELLEKSVPVHGRGNFPTLNIKLKDIIRNLHRRLIEKRIKVRDVRINGGAASYVLALDNNYPYSDVDIIFSCDLLQLDDVNNESTTPTQTYSNYNNNNYNPDQCFTNCCDIIKETVFECLLDYLPKTVCKDKISSINLKDAYVKKMVKIYQISTNNSENTSLVSSSSSLSLSTATEESYESLQSSSRWSLISLYNNQGQNIELKFVDKMKRQFQFSVDAFQIHLDSLLQFYQCQDSLQTAPSSSSNPISEFNNPQNNTVITENFFPSVIAESMYGDYEETVYHLNNKIIATRTPEEIRGGGLLKYCNLLIRGYKPVYLDSHMQTLEKYMCSRFFIDFSDLQEQEHKLNAYLDSHFQNDTHMCIAYLDKLYDVVNASTVCLMGHERKQTLNLIDSISGRFKRQFNNNNINNNNNNNLNSKDNDQNHFNNNCNINNNCNKNSFVNNFLNSNNMNQQDYECEFYLEDNNNNNNNMNNLVEQHLNHENKFNDITNQNQRNYHLNKSNKLHHNYQQQQQQQQQLQYQNIQNYNQKNNNNKRNNRIAYKFHQQQQHQHHHHHHHQQQQHFNGPFIFHPVLNGYNNALYYNQEHLMTNFIDTSSRACDINEPEISSSVSTSSSSSLIVSPSPSPSPSPSATNLLIYNKDISQQNDVNVVCDESKNNNNNGNNNSNEHNPLISSASTSSISSSSSSVVSPSSSPSPSSMLYQHYPQKIPHTNDYQYQQNDENKQTSNNRVFQCYMLNVNERSQIEVIDNYYRPPIFPWNYPYQLPYDFSVCMLPSPTSVPTFVPSNNIINNNNVITRVLPSSFNTEYHNSNACLESINSQQN